MHPLIETLNFAPDTMELYKKFHHLPYTVFLDSSMRHARLGRYSFITGDPFLVFSSKGKKCYLRTAEETTVINDNPFDLLQKLIKKYKIENTSHTPPFPGGVAGYFSYDMGRHLENLPDDTLDDINFPDCCLGFYDWSLVIDHQAEVTYLVSTGFPLKNKKLREEKATARLKEIENIFYGKPTPNSISPTGNLTPGNSFSSNFTRENYFKAITKAKEYIVAGDIYQVNMTQRLQATIKVSPLALYEKLRKKNPAPFASFLNFPGSTIASSSPERFIKLVGTQLETRPIKGTRPRGKTPEQDATLKKELLASKKDRAELLMIVDLERNDLSKVCCQNSVKVPELFTLETYATVHHLVSTVEGTLSPDIDMIDVLKATFPGGSITGCPKIRAMEIIEELEPTKRSVYTGSIGYIGFNGNSDFNIAIRTFLIKNNNAFFQVGGAIVADSEPESEYQETFDKAKALLDALGLKEKEVCS